MKTLRFAIVGLCLPLLACYEEPVRDHLHIVFSPGPAIIVTAIRDIAPPAAAGDNPIGRGANGRGPQRSRLGLGPLEPELLPRLDAIADRSTIERHDGQPRRGIHSALLDSFRPVERLLGNEGLGAFYDENGGSANSNSTPSGPARPPGSNGPCVEHALNDWSHEVAAYLEATAALYAHLDRAPDRAALCFGYIFDEDQESLGPLGKTEGELVAAVIDAMERVAAVLRIDKGQAYSLNELSRLVYDTFQGRLTVTLDGPVVEIEGFVDTRPSSSAHRSICGAPSRPWSVSGSCRIWSPRWRDPDRTTSNPIRIRWTLRACRGAGRPRPIPPPLRPSSAADFSPSRSISFVGRPGPRPRTRMRSIRWRSSSWQPRSRIFRTRPKTAGHANRSQFFGRGFRGFTRIRGIDSYRRSR